MQRRAENFLRHIVENDYVFLGLAPEDLEAGGVDPVSDVKFDLRVSCDLVYREALGRVEREHAIDEGFEARGKLFPG